MLNKYYHITASAIALAAFAFLVSCSEDETEAPATAKALTIGVETEPWGNGDTRASYSDATENHGYINFPTMMSDGDAIGVFIVDANGKVTVANRKYTFDGTAWATDTPLQFADSLRSASFYAYYPYHETITGAPAAGDTTGIVADTVFFKNVISSWTVSADQSTLSAFTASDLMTGAGTISEPFVNELHIAFTIRHRMGLLITKAAWTAYYDDKPDSTWTQTQTFTGNIPYSITGNGLLYFIAKPGTATTLGTKTRTLETGQAEQLYFSNGEPITRSK